MKKLVLTIMVLMAFTLAHADYHYVSHTASNLILHRGIFFARITQWKVDYLSRTQKLVILK